MKNIWYYKDDYGDAKPIPSLHTAKHANAVMIFLVELRLRESLHIYNMVMNEYNKRGSGPMSELFKIYNEVKDQFNVLEQQFMDNWNKENI